MRTLLLLLVLGCQDAALQQIDKEIAGAQGTQAGVLLEKKADLLEKKGRFREAAETYEAAAGAYSQSPEGNSGPPERARHARQEAERVRKLVR